MVSSSVESVSLVVAQASALCSNCLHRLPNCLLSVMIMCTAVNGEAAASSIFVGSQPRIRCWARARSSSSDLVDTATARRQQRVEDATRVGLQFPFRSERRGRGAPSVAMKWRDAVKAAIMHGPLPPDVTLDAPHWWLPGMPLLPPADYRLLRPIGYCRFELNVWVWRSFFGLIRSLKTGLFLTFWKVNWRDSRRSGRLQKKHGFGKNQREK